MIRNLQLFTTDLSHQSDPMTQYPRPGGDGERQSGPIQDTISQEVLIRRIITERALNPDYYFVGFFGQFSTPPQHCLRERRVPRIAFVLLEPGLLLMFNACLSETGSFVRSPGDKKKGTLDKHVDLRPHMRRGPSNPRSTVRKPYCLPTTYYLQG